MLKQSFYAKNKKEVSVLLIEDDIVDQMAIRRAFQKLDLNNPLIIAKNGLEGLEQLRSAQGGEVHRPYLIILDLSMPRMNGFEFLEFIRNDKELVDSVVFVLTTSSELKDKLRAYKQNIAGYMCKKDFAHKNYKSIFEMLSKYWKIMELPA